MQARPPADFLPQLVDVDGVRVPWFIAPFTLHGKEYDFCEKERRLYALYTGDIQGKVTEEERLGYHDELSLLSPAFWIHEHLWIVNKSFDTVPLNRWTYGQRLLYFGWLVQDRQLQPVRIIILKSRQIGATTIAGALLYWKDFWHDNQHIMVIADLSENALNAFSMVVRFHDELHRTVRPSMIPLVQSKTVRKDHAWLHYGMPRATNLKSVKAKDGTIIGRVLNNRYRVGTASSTIRQHSKTHSAVHGTEVPYWPNPETLWLGLAQTIPNRAGTVIILEGTANAEKDGAKVAAGAGWFEARWDLAESGKSSFLPIFVGWTTMPWVFEHGSSKWIREYSAELPTEFQGEDGNQAFMDGLDKFELDIVKRHPDITPEQLHWRRLVIADQCNGDVKQFQQEYPSFAAEAFMTLGRGVYDRDMIKHYLDQTNPRAECNQSEWRGNFSMLNSEDRDYDQTASTEGWTTVWKWPEPGHSYVLSGDPAEGWDEKSDMCSADVMDAATWEQVAHCFCSGGLAAFAEQMTVLYWIYAEPLTIPETNGLGQQLISDLKRLGVSNFYHRTVVDKSSAVPQQKDGFHSGAKTKQLLIGRMKRTGVNHDFTLHSRVTASQIKTMVRLPDGSFKASGRKKDDAHDSWALALCAVESDQVSATEVTIGGKVFTRPTMKSLVEDKEQQLLGYGLPREYAEVSLADLLNEGSQGLTPEQRGEL